jgi:hypothetical protein
MKSLADGGEGLYFGVYCNDLFLYKLYEGLNPTI